MSRSLLKIGDGRCCYATLVRGAVRSCRMSPPGRRGRGSLCCRPAASRLRLGMGFVADRPTSQLAKGCLRPTSPRAARRGTSTWSVRPLRSRAMKWSAASARTRMAPVPDHRFEQEHRRGGDDLHGFEIAKYLWFRESTHVEHRRIAVVCPCPNAPQEIEGRRGTELGVPAKRLTVRGAVPAKLPSGLRHQRDDLPAPGRAQAFRHPVSSRC